MSADYGSPVKLAQKLIRTPSVGPEHGEAACAALCAEVLEAAGFQVRQVDLAPGRPNIIAVLPGSEDGPMFCLSGHTDTVPLGAADWSFDPFCGDIDSGRLLGRGASDMKSGVAAMLGAALRIAAGPKPRAGLALIFTAGEEQGLRGAKFLKASAGVLPDVGAVIVGEPTGNKPLLGHKGGLWFDAEFHGKAAHASTPHLGDSAVIKAAEATLALSGFEFDQRHPVMGRPTINIGVITGGNAPNIVPDHCLLKCDVRVLPGTDPDEMLGRLGRAAPGASLGNINFLPPVWTGAEDPWAAGALEVISGVTGQNIQESAAPYVTDASILGPLFKAPALIIGPGDPGQLHKTDEWCDAGLIGQAEEIYFRLAANFCGV